MEIFSNGYYKINRVCLSVCGIWPEQQLIGAYIAQAIVIGTLFTLIIPEAIYFYENVLYGSIMNDAILSLPSMLSLIVGVIKVHLISHKKRTFQTAIDEMRNDWKLLGDTPAGGLMHKYAARGRACTLFYMGFLFPAMTVFLAFPMTPIFLDFIIPLNETRSRPPLYDAEYGVDNQEDYFFLLTLHGYVASITIIIVLWTIDSFIMIMVQHCCGLFEIVGFTLQELNPERETKSEKDQNDIISYAISIHKRAILFADFIGESLMTMYAYVIFINMVAISITGVGTAFQMDQTEKALRFGLLGVGQMAHLFFNSIPGQQLIDHSSRVFDTIYSAEWHLIPIRSQKLILMMLMRSSKPNNLTAGGFYQLNMENFSQVMQTSMSYMTVLMSLG